VGHPGVGTEGDAALFDVGTGDVDLHAGNSLHGVEAFGQAGVGVHGGAIQVGDYRNGEPAEKGHLALEKGLKAHIFQADGIEHAAGGFRDPGRWIALGRLQGKPFDDGAAQPVEIHQGAELPGIPEGSGGGHDRVLQFKAADVDCEIRLRHGPSLQSFGFAIKLNRPVEHGMACCTNPDGGRTPWIFISLIGTGWSSACC
jgi:hypothetical protein